MQNTEKQIHKFSLKLLSDTFLKDVSKESIKLELCSSIIEGYTNRVKRGQSQDEYSKEKKISVSTVKRIENGTCYDCRMISKYSN